jgi:WD40 repeat protein
MTGSKGGKLNLWDIETGRPAFTLLEGHHLSCDWSPDGRKLVAGTNDSRIEIWDATAGYEQAMVSGDNNRITATKPYALDQRDRNALSSNDR